MDKEEAVKAGLYQVIGKEIDDTYIEALKSQVIHWDSIKEAGKDLKVVYTPLHGTGNIPARRVLKELGFEHVNVVKEQELPDGDFPTVSYPNPEAEEAFELGLKLAKEIDADLVLATDPDADRLGVRVKDQRSAFTTLSLEICPDACWKSMRLSQRLAMRRQAAGGRSCCQAPSLPPTWQAPLQELTT